MKTLVYTPSAVPVTVGGRQYPASPMRQCRQQTRAVSASVCYRQTSQNGVGRDARSMCAIVTAAEYAVVRSHCTVNVPRDKMHYRPRRDSDVTAYSSISSSICCFAHDSASTSKSFGTAVCLFLLSGHIHDISSSISLSLASSCTLCILINHDSLAFDSCVKGAVNTYMRAACFNTSRHVKLSRSSFSISVFAICRPLPVAHPR